MEQPPWDNRAPPGRAPERSASRHLDGGAAQPVDRIFKKLPGLLVFNDTLAVKARLAA